MQISRVSDATVISNVTFFSRAAVAADRRLSDVRLMWMECPSIARTARPGQFVMVRCGDLPLPRPISVHQIRDDSIALFFSVLADGKGTRWLSERQPDDRLGIFGPLGNGFNVPDSAQRLLLVAGGMGIAPLAFLAQRAASEGRKVTLLLGARTGGLVYSQRLLPHSVNLFVVTEDGSAGQIGMVTAVIREHSDNADCVFACGPEVMLRQIAERRAESGLEGKPVQVSLEAMMACGHGICYGCTRKTRRGLKQVCKDGPVFDLDDLVWEASQV
jgi:dihydroorotate dehydrogenase electron transfer subunit